MKILKHFILLFIICVVSAKAYSAVFSFEAEPDVGTAVFPAGTMFRTILQNTVSSKDSKVGDKISMVLMSNVTVGKSICMPKDSVFLGEIIELRQADQGRDGYFRIIVGEVVFSDGWRTKLDARLSHSGNADAYGGQRTERTEYTKVPHYIQDIGPVVKLVKTGPRLMGQEKVLSEGEEVIIVLLKELQVKYLQKL